MALKIVLDGETYLYDVEMPEQNADDFIYGWLLCKCRMIFDTMPHERIDIAGCEELSGALNVFASITQFTNKAIGVIEKGFAIGSKNVLFWNVSEDLRYKSLYDRLSKKSNIKYLNLELGFDRKLRKWKPTPLPMSVDALLKYIRENEIGKIVTVNSYVIDKYLHETGINLVTVFEHIGVRLITIDNDPFDITPTGFLRRLFLNSRFRFSNLSVLNEDFDKKNNVNAHYVAIPQGYGSEKPKELKDDYDVIVLSNSRFQNVKQVIKAIEIVMGGMKDKCQEINLWYLALRHLILNVFVIPEFRMQHYNAALHQFYFACVQWLKYEIIKEIKTDREVKVYGDVGWNEVCPQYYKGSLGNDEINRMYDEGNHLYLLLNASFSYLDASGPVYDVIRRRVQWINIPPMAKTKEFDGLGCVEYSGAERLNELINNYTVDKGYGKSIGYYESILKSSVDDIENHVFGLPQKVSEFTRQRLKHKKIIDRITKEYIDNNEPFLRHTYRRLFCEPGR
ncbi:MAG: hypothetical protein H7831_06860 [Magnetococcus sp. WYHC-3]